jgi:predicted nuclease of predicted toxin-antitoxin system
VRILIDMNLPPRWKVVFERAGHEVQHWSEVGAPDATDRAIMRWARKQDYIVFTHDLDFSALLAATQATAPSVIQVRTEDVLSEALVETVVRTTKRVEHELKKGALLSVDLARARVRVLPFGE